jgi:hypothetical protein
LLLTLLVAAGCQSPTAPARTCAQVDSAFAAWQVLHPALEAARPICLN